MLLETGISESRIGDETGLYGFMRLFSGSKRIQEPRGRQRLSHPVLSLLCLGVVAKIWHLGIRYKDPICGA